MFFLFACTSPTEETATACAEPGSAVGWSETSHQKGTADYDQVFPRDAVQRLDLTLCPSDFATMTEGLAEIAGPPGGGGGPPPGGGPPTGGGPPPEDAELSAEEPAFVPATLSFDGRTWPWVGVRFKGNSSLAASVAAGIQKLPLRIDMDQYEDTAPETDDQRFFGFQKLSLGPGYGDPSYTREVLTAELMEDVGVPVARAAFYELWVDAGEGPLYWGLYTVVEDPENAVFLDRNFDDDDGALFQPDGTCADWTCFDEAGFGDQTGDESPDYTEAEAAVTALLADTTDAEAWRAELEAHFDVDTFLTWLATSTAIGNWDSYGQMAHNYFLYAPPGEPLVWIPWDHNMALTDDWSPILSLSLDEVGDEWPLIRRLLDDPVYAERYAEALADTRATLDAEVFTDRAEALHTMIAPYVEAEAAPLTQLESIDAFTTSVSGDDGLSAWMESRITLLDEAAAE